VLAGLVSSLPLAKKENVLYFYYIIQFCSKILFVFKALEASFSVLYGAGEAGIGIAELVLSCFENLYI
jgi:hypothetical protein